MSLQLLRLLQLSDPALPIGGFSHSAGLETYVQAGRVGDRASAERFIKAMLTRNLRNTDGAFVSMAYDAAASASLGRLLALDGQLTAIKIAAETRQASQKLGNRLLKLFKPMKEQTLLEEYTSRLEAGNYAIVFGMLAALLGIDKTAALCGFYYNAASAMVTNAVKLIPLGQQDGQQILFSLHELIERLAQESMHPREETIGLTCTGFDIASMQHEQLYSRLYMS